MATKVEALGSKKLRDYRLQESGLDTMDANLEIGLPDDARHYTAAVAILADLGLTSIMLLANNPDKIERLQRSGIEVADREPLVVGVEPENRGYLEAKSGVLVICWRSEYRRCWVKSKVPTEMLFVVGTLGSISGADPHK